MFKQHAPDKSMLNFQRAAGTLEASIKIYSCRVDDVHKDTFKMLGGLNTVKSKQGCGGGDGEEGEDGEEVRTCVRCIAVVCFLQHATHAHTRTHSLPSFIL